MLYAAYGSNLHPFRLQQRTPSAHLLGTAAVSDMALKFHKRGYRDSSGKCNIVKSDRSRIFVAIYDVAPAEIALLDRYEGAGSGYDRTVVTVEKFGDCVTYIATPAHINERLRPFSWYKALVVAGCERLAFPSYYTEQIRSVAAIVDKKRDRHAEQMQLVDYCLKTATRGSLI